MDSSILDNPPASSGWNDRLHRAVLESTPDLVFVVDRAHLCLYANPAMLAALGRTRDEVAGHNPIDFGYAPWHAAMHDAGVDQVFATGEVIRGEAPFHGRSGWRVHEYMLAPLLADDGGVEAVVTTTRDVTERSEHEERARRNERRLRAIANASSSIIYRMDADWADVQVMLGPGSEDPAPFSRLEAIQSLLHPDDREPLAMATRQAREEATVLQAEYRWRHEDGRYRWLASRVVPVRGEDGTVLEWVGATTDVDGRRQQEQHQKLLLDELNHRVKNTLAVVQSIAVQTLRHATDGAVAVDHFQARLLALAKAHDLLTASRWAGTCLRDVVETAIGPCMGHGLERFSIDGPAVRLCPRPSLALSMALHELCTNAVKYGALSVPAGRVRIHWHIREGDDRRRLLLAWQESGGPPVTPPTRRGFGTRLVERGLRHDLGGEVELAFGHGGVTCSIDMPLAEDDA